jgi:hypothetical protein
MSGVRTYSIEGGLEGVIVPQPRISPVGTLDWGTMLAVGN